MKRVVVINGSHRCNGSTKLLVDNFLKIFRKPGININEFNLCDMNIEYFNYENKYSKNDEYDELCKSFFEADLIIFGSPIYWYSMPARLKTVFDRLSSLYSLGNIDKLVGKKVVLLYTYGGSNSKEDFTFPFRDTCDYLKMNYLGCFGAQTKFPKGIFFEERLEQVKDFAEKIIRKL